MAGLLWGKVFYGAEFAGILREEPGDRTSFAYDPSYLASGRPVAHTLPLRAEPFTHPNGLLPFFDNLVAEGWLAEAQTRLLGKRQAGRFELLLAFGQDCAGAVSVVDPEPGKLSDALLNIADPIEMALMTSRASLSGVQPKLAVIARGGKFYPTRLDETSTHIAKFPSQTHADLTLNEYITMRAFAALLPDDAVASTRMGQVEGIAEPTLIIERFDRGPNGTRYHFEEFNQLLGNSPAAKYDGAYRDMSDFIHTTPGCVPAEVYRLFRRILAGLLLGNTDMHLKNFAMMHTPEGYRLSQSYDQVTASIYNYKTLALAIGGSANLNITDLDAGNFGRLAEEFYLPRGPFQMAWDGLAANRDAAREAIAHADHGSAQLKQQITEQMDKRWNGSFQNLSAWIGKRS